MKRVKSYILIFVILGLFQGCIDGLVTPNNDVNGRIYTNYGFELSRNFYWAKISVGEYPITYTNTSEFSLSAISKPYNLTLMFPYDSIHTEEPSNYKYLGINVNNPVIVNASHYNSNISSATLKCFVTLPNVTTPKKLFCKFISNEKFYQYDVIRYIDSNNSTTSIDILVPKAVNSINGRIYILEFSEEDNTGNIISFDKWGIKDITLGIASNNVIFNKEDLQYDPPEIESNIIAVQPLNSYGRIYLGIGSPGFNKASELHLYQANTTNSKVILPILPGNEFLIKVQSIYGLVASFPYSGSAEKWIYIMPGQNAEIIHNDYLQIVSPLADEENVSLNTQFEIADNTSPGIYVYDIYSINTDYKCMRLISTNKKFKFSDFISEGFEYLPNTRYGWNVKKYLGYNNMDEFVSGVYTTDKKFTILSPGRYFTTTP